MSTVGAVFARSDDPVGFESSFPQSIRLWAILVYVHSLTAV